MAGNSGFTPFKGRVLSTAVPTRVLHRFTRPGHVAEIRERTVSVFAALEWLVFIDGCLTESRLFHGARLARYQLELDARIAQFVDAGWIEEVHATPTA